ncbi:MAG: GntR family transcriptional regulator [Carnobacterium sp.]|uniref:GntR family transcriptional regulator n=1 Tax=Carnobacterium antarcticum TaxID=2126436 RepID=A0ABW4NPX1_9LACT|nr:MULTISPECIES: GntR family transcriptional regulator [unclassified Carnobacterium]ALV22702.1 putative transcriptional regulator of N-Acetylglucosamine utilization, GntR [Carnobacterium sp. CP1]QQP70603.1 GntR family transcriptional regulator [Carnobacterium sp. CS13]
MGKETPIYIQIHNQMRKDIENGIWKVGDRIPSERDLAVQFKVSRMTLRQAVQTLVDEGILERKVGSGTYVSSKKVQEIMVGIASFTDIMLSQGRTPTSKTISYHVKPASVSEAENLKLAEETMVLRMERIRYADDIPICFEVATIPFSLVENLSKQEITRSLYRALEEEKGLHVGHAEQTISAMLASEKIADYLAIKRGQAILRLKQISYSKTGLPFEYVRTQYVGERFEFFLEKNS